MSNKQQDSREMFKDWVWISSVDSVDKLQFSILAFVETLLAVGVSFFVWFYYGFYGHIIIGLLLTFLSLFGSANIDKSIINFLKKNSNNYIRLINIISFTITSFIYLGSFLFFSYFLTQASFNLEGIKIIFGIFAILFSLSMFILPLYFILIPILFILFVLSIKIYYILINLSFETLERISTNWFFLNFMVDIKSKHELVRGLTNKIPAFSLSSIDDKNKLFYKYEIFNKFPYMDGAYELGIMYFYVLPIVLYRYSIKSTAWMYLPLIWLIQPQNKQNLNTQLKIESKNFIAYLMFFYSLIVVFIFTLLPLIFKHTQLGVYLQTLAIPSTLKTIFFAYEFNLWHLTRFVSALITIVFMFSFTKILIRRETEPNYGNFWGAKLLSLRTVRSVLTLVTLGFTAYHILGLLPNNFFSDLMDNMKFLPIDVESK